MAILNRPSHGQPSVLLALWRTLAAYGGVERQELIQLCTPPTPTQDPGQVRQTINTAVSLDLFREAGGTLSLTSGLADVSTDPDRDPLFRGFRGAVAESLMADANNVDLGHPGEEGGRGAADFTYALCWMLEQDPFESWNFGRVENLQGRDFTEKVRRPFQNQIRWSGFVDWATFVGVAWTSSAVRGGVIVDPTEAISTQLSRRFAVGDHLPVGEFVSRLAEVLPVLDGGRYRDLCSASFPSRYSRPEGALTASLSLAIDRLVLAGVLDASHADDAPHAVTLGPRGRSVTHIRVIGGNDD